MLRHVRQWRRPAIIVGGLLWVPYGMFEMLQPWGVDAVFREDRGYEVVVDELVYRVYNLPGGFALLLTAIGLVGMLDGPADKAGRLLGIIAASLGVVSVLGATVGIDPLFTGPRIFGTLALGVATVLAGSRIPAGSRVGRWRRWLIALGGLGIFLLPLWSLVYAVGIIPEWLGAVMIGVFGLGWVLTDVQRSRSPV